MLLTLQQVVQVECSRAVPLRGRAAEDKNKRITKTKWVKETLYDSIVIQKPIASSVASSELVLHELRLLLMDGHPQGCWFDSRQVEPPHPEGHLEEGLHRDSDPCGTKTTNTKVKTQTAQPHKRRSGLQTLSHRRLRVRWVALHHSPTKQSCIWANVLIWQRWCCVEEDWYSSGLTGLQGRRVALRGPPGGSEPDRTPSP